MIFSERLYTSLQVKWFLQTVYLHVVGRITVLRAVAHKQTCLRYKASRQHAAVCLQPQHTDILISTSEKATGKKIVHTHGVV